MPRKTPLLCFTIGMIAKTSLLLQMSNECLYLLSTYLVNIGAQTITAEEIMKVGYASGDNGYRIFALAFGLDAKGVT